MLHVSDSSSVHHQEFFTVHTAMIYVIQFCWQLASRIRTERISSVLILLASWQENCMTYAIVVRTVKNSWWWTEELSETCRILFQYKYDILVHLVVFIIRIYHDARSPEHQIRHQLFTSRHGVTLYKTWIFLSIAVKSSSLAFYFFLSIIFFYDPLLESIYVYDINRNDNVDWIYLALNRAI